MTKNAKEQREEHQIDKRSSAGITCTSVQKGHFYQMLYLSECAEVCGSLCKEPISRDINNTRRKPSFQAGSAENLNRR